VDGCCTGRAHRGPRLTVRVVVVHNRYRSENPSGENRVVESDIDQLRADGVEVIPYIRDSDEIDAFTPVGKAGLAVRPLVSPVDALAFRRLLREVQPHIVHLHNPFPLISPWIVRTAKAQRVPVVQTVHNYRHVCVNGIHFRDGHLCTECVGKKVPWPAVQHGCYQGSRARSVPMAAALVAHRGTWDLVDRFLPVGEGVADHLRAMGIEEERIEVRPNVVDDPGPPAPLGKGVLFVGRLSPEKGIEMLLEAWRLSGLGERGETLSIAGDGELRPVVEGQRQRIPRSATWGFSARRSSTRRIGMQPCCGAVAVARDRRRGNGGSVGARSTRPGDRPGGSDAPHGVFLVGRHRQSPARSVRRFALRWMTEINSAAWLGCSRSLLRATRGRSTASSLPDILSTACVGSPWFVGHCGSRRCRQVHRCRRGRPALEAGAGSGRRSPLPPGTTCASSHPLTGLR
jgi:glycosyltransferase involved in cell wall biosynthesis